MSCNGTFVLLHSALAFASAETVRSGQIHGRPLLRGYFALIRAIVSLNPGDSGMPALAKISDQGGNGLPHSVFGWGAGGGKRSKKFGGRVTGVISNMIQNDGLHGAQNEHSWRLQRP